MTFDRDETRHLARVLRLGPGDLVLATDGLGHEYTVRIETLGVAATGTVLDAAPRLTESPVAVTLVQGIPKGDKMETIIRAATELGVTRIAPALTARTVVSLEEDRWRERARRWQRVAREAAKQCGRAVVPEVMEPAPLRARSSRRPSAASCEICLWEGERRPLGEVLQDGRGAAQRSPWSWGRRAASRPTKSRVARSSGLGDRRPGPENPANGDGQPDRRGPHRGDLRRPSAFP